MLFGCSSTQADHQPLNGWVQLIFDIDEQGKPINIRVQATSRDDEKLHKPAIKALSKWKYRPKIVDGQAVVQKDQKVRLDFTPDPESE